MRSLVLWAGLSSFLLAPTALSQKVYPTVLHFADDYSAAFEEAKDRNVPLLIMDYDGWEGDDTEFHTDKRFLAAAEYAVLMLIGQHRHNDVKELRDGEERIVCSSYGGVPCKTHMKLLNLVYQEFFQDQDLKSPMFLVLTPDKQQLDKFLEETSSAQVTLALRNAQRKLGPGIARTAYATIGKELLELAAAIERSDWREACERWTAARALELGTESGPAQRLAEASKALAEAFASQREAAVGQWDAGEHRAALFALDEAVWACDEAEELLPDGADLLKTWSKTPEGKALSRELRDERKARDLFTKGEAAYEAGDESKAKRSLQEVVRKYEASKWAEFARGILSVLGQ